MFPARSQGLEFPALFSRAVVFSAGGAGDDNLLELILDSERPDPPPEERAKESPGFARLCGNERLRGSGAFFCGAQARLALRAEAPTRLIARRML